MPSCACKYCSEMVITLCDDNGPFLRYLMDGGSGTIEPIDTLIDGSTSYTPVGIVTTCGNAVQGADFYQSVSEGLVPGYSSIRKFGENPNIDASVTFKTLWDGGGVYIPPTVERIHDVVSDNAADAGTVLSTGTATGGSVTQLVDTGATFQTDTVSIGDCVLNDTDIEIGKVSAIPSETEITIIASMRSPNDGVAGVTLAGKSYRVVTNASTGASIYHIVGLDGTYQEQEEFVVLNGVVNVPTNLAWFRQHRARVFGPNTAGAIGLVMATAQVDLTISSQIVDGNNQTLMAVYTIPAGKVGYIADVHSSLSKKQAATVQIRLRTGELHAISYINQSRSLLSAASSSLSYTSVIREQLVAGVDIWLEASSDTATVGVSGGFDIILKDM